MVTEIYRNKKTDLSAIEKVLGSQTERVELLREFGLKAQLADLSYPQLTPDEFLVWEKFLPRRYGGDGSGSYEIKHYSFDEIPLEVLREWKHAQDLEIFDRFYIRTPESAVQYDPILLGYIFMSHNWWLIARWGESLLPFNEIRDLVFPRISNVQKTQTLASKFLRVFTDK